MLQFNTDNQTVRIKIPITTSTVAIMLNDLTSVVLTYKLCGRYTNATVKKYIKGLDYLKYHEYADDSHTEVINSFKIDTKSIKSISVLDSNIDIHNYDIHVQDVASLVKIKCDNL